MGNAPSRRIVFLCGDPVSESPCGTAIRAVGLARAATGLGHVVLASPDAGVSSLGDVEVRSVRLDEPRAIRALALEADVVVAPALPPPSARAVARSGARFIVDLYAPVMFEALERFGSAPGIEQRFALTRVTDSMRASMESGDAFLCGSERHRDLWIGALLALAEIEPASYSIDPSLESVVAVVPTGIPTHPPPPTIGDPIRAALPGIPADAPIVLWNGGVHPWLDPVVAVRAIALLREGGGKAVLVFMGGVAPDSPPLVEASRLGLLDTGVFANPHWVPFDDRIGWLDAAACVVSCHPVHLESRFAIRTRLFDCVWAGAPIVCTEGDFFSDLVALNALGRVVAPDDPAALAGAMSEVITAGKSAFREAFDAVRHDLAWDVVTRPLLALIERPRLPREARRRRSSLAIRVRDVVERVGSRARRIARGASRG